MPGQLGKRGAGKENIFVRFLFFAALLFSSMMKNGRHSYARCFGLDRYLYLMILRSFTDLLPADSASV